MLVEFKLERLHEPLKIHQRSRGLCAIIRCGGAKVAGLIEARVRAIRATKVLTGGWTIVTAKIRANCRTGFDVVGVGEWLGAGICGAI